MITPKDRQQKKPTNAQIQAKAEEKAVQKVLQDWYYRGIKYGSDMQLGTILDVYKKKFDTLPKSLQTKATYEEMLNKIFTFCSLGLASDIQAILQKKSTEEEIGE